MVCSPGSNVCVRITKPATIQISLNNVKPYDVMPAETVPQFKIKVYHVEQVPVDRQILLFGGRQLEDDKTLKTL